MKKEDWGVLSNDLKVLYKIYEYSDKKSVNVWFSKLVTNLKGDASKATISKSIDKLYDIGYIDGEWKKEGDSWVRAFNVAGEAKSFAKEIYDYINR